MGQSETICTISSPDCICIYCTLFATCALQLLCAIHQPPQNCTIMMSQNHFALLCFALLCWAKPICFDFSSSKFYCTGSDTYWAPLEMLLASKPSVLCMYLLHKVQKLSKSVKPRLNPFLAESLLQQLWCTKHFLSLSPFL